MTQILLEECYDEDGKYLGKITVTREQLTTQLKDTHSPEAIRKIAEASGLPVAAVENLTMIAFLKADIAGKDHLGYGRYRDILKQEGFDV